MARAGAALTPAALVAAAAETVPRAAQALFEALVARRAAGEPVARILGHREFRGLDFALNASTLVPRPETELLVEAVLAAAPRLPSRPVICDLGTGSGAILVALLAAIPAASGVGVDIAGEALAAARANAATHGVADRARFAHADFAAAPPPGAPFDVLVANPPYIESAAISGLPRDVRDHDPRAALDGGADGFDAYRAILKHLGGSLRAGGFLAFEVGAGQAEAVAALAEAAGLAEISVGVDLGGIDRVVSGWLPL